jgi:hypothetical protein
MKKLNLSEGELRVAAADDSGETDSESLYLAFRVRGVRVEIEGPATTALALAEAVCKAGNNLGVDHD